MTDETPVVSVEKDTLGDGAASTTTAVVPVAPLQDKFKLLKDTLNTEVFERSTIIETQILALLSRSHHFQLGSPGVAKSLGIRKLISHIDGFTPDMYFEILMSRFTTPDEIFGPMSLTALQQDRMRKVTTLMLPEASIAFLDEIWKANSANLNSLLMALNERLFRNDGAVQPIPLWSMFCASNELPESEELNALFDRIHFRHVVKPISEAGNFIRMLQSQTVKTPSVGAIVSWSEIQQAYQQIEQVDIPTDVFEALFTVRKQLKDSGVEPTDRRFSESLRVIRAAAWLDGETEADLEHVRPLRHMLWNSLDEISVVERVLLELANPLDKEAMDLLEQIQKIADELDKVLKDDYDKQAKNKKGIELHNKVDRAKEELEDLIARSKKQNKKRRSEKIDEAKTLLLRTTRTLLKEVFGIDVEKAEK